MGYYYTTSTILLLVIAAAVVSAGNYRNADNTCVAGYFKEGSKKICEAECEQAYKSLFTKGVCRKISIENEVCNYRCGFTLNWWTSAIIIVTGVAACVTLVLLCPICISSCGACFSSAKASDNARKGQQMPMGMQGEHMTTIDVAPQKSGPPTSPQQQQQQVAAMAANQQGTLGYGNYGSYGYWPYMNRY